MAVESVQRAWLEACTRFEHDNHGLGVFRDAYLVVNSKNTKLQDPKSTLLETLAIFRGKMNMVFNSAYIKYYADIGVKIVPTYSSHDANPPHYPIQTQRATSQDTMLSGEGGTYRIAESPSTYLWRACCLEGFYSDLKKQAFAGAAGKKQVYNNGFLRDATAMTIEPPAKSWLRKGGVLYLQAYNSVKEIEDAQQVHPFDRPLLSNLSLAADIVGPLTLSVGRADLIQSYCGSKARVLREYRDWRSTAFGARFEVRVSNDIIDGIYNRLEDTTSERYILPRLSARTPEFLWCIPTFEWCDFMHGNYHKITSFLEMIVLSGPQTGIPLPTSQLLFAVFAYLRGFSNSNPARKSLLWSEYGAGSGKQRLGFNLKHSITTYGFGWLAPHIDWQGLRLLPHAVGKLIGCGGTIGSGYHQPMRQVQDQRAILELLYNHISRAEKNSPRTIVALKTMAHYILRQYRRDVLKFLARNRELHTEYIPDAAHDRVMFCHTELTKVLVQQPFYVKGGRVCGYDDATKVFELLMGTGRHERKRDHFDKIKRKEWRQMIWKTKDFFDRHANLQELWAQRFRLEFERYMFSIPYPDPSGVFLETHSPTGQRKFFAAGHINGRWRCVEDNPRLDCPPEYPKTLWMSLEDLDQYLQRYSDQG